MNDRELVIVHAADVEAEEVVMDGASGTRMRKALTEREGSPTCALRIFDVEPGGHTPFHTHDWEHLNYILGGHGMIRTENGDNSVRAGDVCLVKPGLKHQYVNTGNETFSFICLVPV